MSTTSHTFGSGIGKHTLSFPLVYYLHICLLKTYSQHSIYILYLAASCSDVSNVFVFVYMCVYTAAVSTYNCDFCRKAITDVSLRCNECDDFDLCLACFSSGVELGKHKNSHDYRIVVQYMPHTYICT